MDLGLAGRVALVTGGSRGIGRSIAMTLAHEGVDVAICARGIDDLEKTASEVRSATGRRCLPVQVDLSRLEGCQHFVRTATEQFGRADILICCANELSTGGGLFASMPDDQWVDHIGLKLFSAVRCAREVLPHMRANRWGRIVLIGGMATRLVRLYSMDNGVICSGLTNFAKQLAAQVIGDGIRVNAVHPDLTMTGLMMNHLAHEAHERGVPVEEVKKEQAAKRPLGRFNEPEDTANLVAFLCSNLADAITGQSIAVDGGGSMAVHY